MTTTVSGAKHGWTLLEAMERTAAPAVWQAWLVARAAYEKSTIPIQCSPGSHLARPAPEQRALREVALAAHSRLKAEFREHLLAERLVAIGSRGAKSEIPTAIYADGWKTLILKNLETSIIQERGGSREGIYNVRVFPFVHGPHAATKLIGLSLAQAFRKCVLQDPEIVRLAEPVRSRDGNEPVFSEGQFPGPFISFTWPVGVTAKDLAFDFVRQIAYFVSSPIPQPSKPVEIVASELADRWNGLTELLCSGQIIARGTFAKTGMVGFIDPLQWARQEIYVDIKNGDLMEKENHRPALRWSGLMLVAPTSAFAALHLSEHQPLERGALSPENAQAKSSKPLPAQRGPTALHVSIAQAVRSLWPNGIPSGLQAQVRDQKIIDWQRKNDLAVASRKTIGRHLKSGCH